MGVVALSVPLPCKISGEMDQSVHLREIHSACEIGVIASLFMVGLAGLRTAILVRSI